MTKKELEKVGMLNIELDQLKKLLDKTNPKYAVDFVRASSPHCPYTEHNVKIEGNDYNAYDKKIASLERKIKRKSEEIMDEVDRITDQIDAVDDSLIRQILRYKYINRLTMEQIGKEIGYSYSSVKLKHSDFMKSIATISHVKDI